MNSDLKQRVDQGPMGLLQYPADRPVALRRVVRHVAGQKIESQPLRVKALIRV